MRRHKNLIHEAVHTSHVSGVRGNTMARAPRFEEVRREYASLWQSMQTRQNWTGAIDRRAKQIIGNRSHYQDVSDLTGVPWWMVGVIHSMESGLNFGTHLHNGDSLKKRTWRVPRGRPLGSSPPYTWEYSACDALRMKSWHKITDWSIERVLYELERYNGWGYRLYRGIQSPYLWSGTQHYSRGKYVADGKWSASAVSGQTGCAPLLARIFEIADTLPIPVDDIPLPVRKPDAGPDPAPVQAEEDDPNPVPRATVPEDEAPMTAAAGSSKTILGALAAFIGAAASWLQDGAKALLEAARQVTELAPLEPMFASLGANMGSVAFGLTTFGIILVITRRLQAAAERKIG
jgi:lysozyme family protein